MDKTETEKAEFAYGFFVGFALCIVCVIFFATISRDVWRQEACKRGVATWETNPITGESTWRWKVEVLQDEPKK